MKSLRIILLVLITTVFVACRHSSEPPLYIQKPITQLNTVIAPWVKDNDLLPWKGVGHTDIINSVEDVYSTQTSRFITDNPNWLNIDFTTKSIVTVRTILMSFDYWQYSAVLGFSLYNGDNDGFMMTGDYYLLVEENYLPHDSTVEDGDESQYRICQIAFVTEKIPSDAHIVVNWGYSTSIPQQ